MKLRELCLIIVYTNIHEDHVHIFPKEIYETILRTLSLTFEPYQLRT